MRAMLFLSLTFPRGGAAWTGRVPALCRLSDGRSRRAPRSALAARPRMDVDISLQTHELGNAPAAVARRFPSRRAFLAERTAGAVLAGTAALAADATPGRAAGREDDLINVYFGCGCFWHVQHEFVEAERKILGRADGDITSRAGYAGGRAGAAGGKVCYHNAQNVADYGKLGHAEVVSLRIPASKFELFAVEYCKLFDRDGFRPDQAGDRGPEYRNLVGIPGGKQSPLAQSLVKSSVASGDKLDFAVGKGDDKDLPKVSFIMDTADFPFFVAEEYHQFHDGFKLDENYPNAYNSLASVFAKQGEDFGACPNGMMGLGIGGL